MRESSGDPFVINAIFFFFKHHLSEALFFRETIYFWSYKIFVPWDLFEKTHLPRKKWDFFGDLFMREISFFWKQWIDKYLFSGGLHFKKVIYPQKLAISLWTYFWEKPYFSINHIYFFSGDLFNKKPTFQNILFIWEPSLSESIFFRNNYYFFLFGPSWRKKTSS